jgi:hypothetical protein
MIFLSLLADAAIVLGSLPVRYQARLLLEIEYME